MRASAKCLKCKCEYVSEWCPKMDEHPIQNVLLPHSQCPQGRLQVLWDPDIYQFVFRI